jgi:hypothetical protein
MNIYKKLMQARLELQTMDLKKTGLNSYSGYSYFELGDFMPKVMSIFGELGLCGVVSYGADIARLTIVDTEGEGSIEITSPMSKAALKGCHDVQNLGAVQTYLRRYLWVTALEIVEHDALENTQAAVKRGKADPVIVTPTKGAADDLPADVMEFLRDMAIDLIDMCKQGKPREAYERVLAESLDADQHTALWTLLPSNVRSAIKTAKITPL